jgi:hypothetical protein
VGCMECRQCNSLPLMYSQFCYHYQKYSEKKRATMHYPIKELLWNKSSLFNSTFIPKKYGQKAMKYLDIFFDFGLGNVQRDLIGLTHDHPNF